MPARPPFPLSDHCDGHRFFNPRGHVNRSWRDVLKWRRTSQARPWPQSVAVTTKPLAPLQPGRWACTCVNHSTFLLQTGQGNVLTDPVYSAHAGPFGRLGPKRAHAPGVPFAELPAIDIVLLSHDHYDHCDLPTLRRLAARFQPHAITPLGNVALLRRAGFPAEKITGLDWWQSQRTATGLQITVTPSRHWSNRLSGPRNGRLWGGFYLTGDGHRVAFVGDTGYDPEFFSTTRQRLGPPDLALIPIGAYEPRWFMAPQHCNPAEAVQIHRDLGARRSVAMHWGTFQLTDEAREDPVRALTAARTAAAVPADEFQVLQPGERCLI